MIKRARCVDLKATLDGIVKSIPIAEAEVAAAERDEKSADAEALSSTEALTKAEKTEKSLGQQGSGGAPSPEEHDGTGMAVGITVLVIFLIAVGVAIGLIYCNCCPSAATASLHESLNNNRPGLGACGGCGGPGSGVPVNGAMLTAVAGLCVALLFAIVIPSSNTLYTQNTGVTSLDFGTSPLAQHIPPYATHVLFF